MPTAEHRSEGATTTVTLTTLGTTMTPEAEQRVPSALDRMVQRMDNDPDNVLHGLERISARTFKLPLGHTLRIMWGRQKEKEYHVYWSKTGPELHLGTGFWSVDLL